MLGGGVLQWHIDGAFYEHAPSHFTQMRCIEAPAGKGHWLTSTDDEQSCLWCPAGSTAFASGRIAYDLIPLMSDNDACIPRCIIFLGHLRRPMD